MKKLLAIFLVLVMSLAVFTACNTSTTNDADDVDGTGTAAVGGDDAADKMDGSDLAYILDKGKMIVGVTVYAPMNYKDDDGKWTGFDTEFAEKVGEKLGVDVEFIAIDWGGKINEINSKAIDCVWNGMTLTPEVTNSMACSEAYCNNAQVVVVKSDVAEQYQTKESLSELSFAVEAGSAGEAAVKELGLEPVAVQNQAAALMEVKAGTADACVIDLLMAGAMIGEGTSYPDLSYTVELTSEEYGVGFRTGSDLAAKLNEFFKASYDDGSMLETAKQYGVQESIVAK